MWRRARREIRRIQRRREAELCVVSVLDQFFIETWSGDMRAADVLAARIVAQLDDEGRLR